MVLSGVVDDCPIDWSKYENVSKEKALIKCLLEKYKNYTTVGRPVTKTSDMITVEFGLSLIQIMDVDEKNQVLETNVWYTYVSNNKRLILYWCLFIWSIINVRPIAALNSVHRQISIGVLFK